MTDLLWLQTLWQLQPRLSIDPCHCRHIQLRHRHGPHAVVVDHRHRTLRHHIVRPPAPSARSCKPASARASRYRSASPACQRLRCQPPRRQGHHHSASWAAERPPPCPRRSMPSPPPCLRRQCHSRSRSSGPRPARDRTATVPATSPAATRPRHTHTDEGGPDHGPDHGYGRDAQNQFPRFVCPLGWSSQRARYRRSERSGHNQPALGFRTQRARCLNSENLCAKAPSAVRTARRSVAMAWAPQPAAQRAATLQNLPQTVRLHHATRPKIPAKRYRGSRTIHAARPRVRWPPTLLREPSATASSARVYAS